METNSNHPKNDINSVSFPEGQLLANGASAEETANISAAYHLGKPLPTSDIEVINRVADRLTQTSGYGKYSDWGKDE
ncbi:hypothetical protein [Tolypothrix sp. PCC 7601]|uniref:hypothetical protein n=1 Tax=Tolypothrix sp. PCC 7601 TaxID=1188 RepID=UPI0005EAB782|nr:hypothetical protein [Tolypothrix sp. PCC 7601]EKE98975.1 hypothetical protein FDUTEX481_03163 [Tolypothrix sp. PCC 7601]UYD35657.1 hypothetical protein HG267_07810 [Tolypothrix sp. PCC 7601]BAY94779.1 hypothetical protein NIES3275_68330 [Microchaete diplosiphon NIES-3275]